MMLYSSGALDGLEMLSAPASAYQKQPQQLAVRQIKTSPSSGQSTPVVTTTGTTSPLPTKLFVGGLSWQTSSENLQEYFSMFGAVTDVLIVMDPVTQAAILKTQILKCCFSKDSHRPDEAGTKVGVLTAGRAQSSRGFGFITFQEAASVDKVLAVPVHMLDGKRIDPKHATPKGAPKSTNTKKIFVGGVGQDTSADEVRAYFLKFGLVEDALMLMDQQTKRHRGFGFVTFNSEEAVERVCDIHFHTIKNKKVECKRAQPREAAPGARPALRPGREAAHAAGAAPGAAPGARALAYRYAPYALPAAAALVAPPAPPPAPPARALQHFGAPYSLVGLDVSSFQGVDWSAIYGLPLYI